MAALAASAMWAGVRKSGWPASSRIAPGIPYASLAISRMPLWWASRRSDESGGSEVVAIGPEV